MLVSLVGLRGRGEYVAPSLRGGGESTWPPVYGGEGRENPLPPPPLAYSLSNPKLILLNTPFLYLT